MIRPPGCSASGALSFVGGGSTNVAGGSAAGILSGAANRACDSDSTVGAGLANVIGGDGGSSSAAIDAGSSDAIEAAAGALIGGGRSNVISALPPYYNSNLSAIGGGESNTIESPDSFIGSGQANTIVPPVLKLQSGNSPSAFIGAGYGNSISSDFAVITGGLGNSNSGEYASIGGGSANAVSGAYGTISGGESNSAGSPNSFVGSGAGNNISANGTVGAPYGPQYATITGGLFNTIQSLISNGAKYGFIGGGHGNTLTAFNGVISGGQYNVASGDYSVVPGGQSNLAAGVDSFAAGNGSQALSSGAFVWSDDATAAKTLKSSGANQFLARAAGGFFLYTSANLSSGVKLAPGSGSWSSLSDRAAKTRVRAIDDRQILEKIAALPVTEWSYTAQGTGVHHLGPMAQDFRAAFGLGEDDRHISAVDEEGVALAAIKGLQAENAAKGREIADLRQARRVDDGRLADLERRLAALEQRADMHRSNAP